MITILPSVQRVLDRIYWQDFGRTGRAPEIYYECIDALKNIPASCRTVIADRSFNWAREKGTVIKVKNLWFLYEKYSDGTVVVEEVYDAKTNQILTESKHKLIKEAITPILDLEERWNRLKY